MNREIRFRVWDLKNKKMFMPDEVSVTILLEDFYHIEDLNGNVIVQPEFVELLQFTGIYDKNNKPVYENDVVEDITSKELYLVKFTNGRFVLFDYYHNYIDRDDEYEGDDLWSISPILKIKGNFFENPELIKEQR